MSKRRVTTAVVLVEKAWYNQTLRFLMGMSPSQSTNDSTS
jgi:hypothetical protein